jgi:hemolysin III
MLAPMLIALGVVWDGTPGVVAALSIYALAMLAMFVCSALYHLWPEETWRDLLRRFDHSAIYVKIAATQTPFALMVGGGKAFWIVAALWIAAAAGAAAKLLLPFALRRTSVALYLLMGWVGLMALIPAADGVALAGPTIVLAAVGGGLYTAGVAFFLWESLPYHNAIWHGFVLVATFVFYGAVLTEIGLRASAMA